MRSPSPSTIFSSEASLSKKEEPLKTRSTGGIDMKAPTKYLVLSLVAALIALGTGQGEAVPIQWTIASGGNDHSYELFTTPMAFADAQAAAIAMGGYLATVTSAAENAFIFTNLVLPSQVLVWLGGFQDPTNPAYSEPAGGWVWATGEPFNTFVNWINNPCCHEPGDTPSSHGQDLRGNEDHLAMHSAAFLNGEWFDIHGASQLGFIVEKDPVADNVQVTKDWRFTNVCFERDNDLDGKFNEDPSDGIDNDLDGKIDEDPVDCPSGTSAGTPLATDPDGDFQVQAVLKKDGTLSSYNPGQIYAVSTVTVLADLDGLEITENYADCTNDTPQILTLNPAVGGGGGSVVVVIDTGDGVLKQILDANSPGVTVTDSQATITLTDVEAGTIIRVYVKFGPGAKGQVLGLPTSCENENSAQVLDEAGGPVGNEVKATAVLEVTAKP